VAGRGKGKGQDGEEGEGRKVKEKRREGVATPKRMPWIHHCNYMTTDHSMHHPG